nr:hypothetical protein GCM10025699_30660 [Microbacterium flavescens]
MAQHVVEMVHVDQPDVDELLELGEAGVRELVEHSDVLAQEEHAGGVGLVDGDVLPGPADDRIDAVHPRPHADVVLVRKRDMPHPVHPQRGTAGVRLELDDDGAGAVRQHPPQEVRVHAGADAVEARLAQTPARQLGADHGHPRVIAQTHLAHGCVERGKARRADAGRREQLHRPAAQSPVDHGREPRDEHIAHRRRRGEHAQVCGIHPPILERGAQRLHGELLVQLGRVAVLVECVVARADAVRGKDTAPDALGDGVVAAEAVDDPAVADRLAGEVAAEAGEIRRRRRAHGATLEHAHACVRERCGEVTKLHSVSRICGEADHGLDCADSAAGVGTLRPKGASRTVAMTATPTTRASPP